MSNNPNPRDILEQLVAFPTISADSNLDLIRFIEDYLGALGVTSQLFLNEEATKANLLARIGPKPQAGHQSGVILSGHSDVVPVAGQDWSSDPFTMRADNDRLYGRGTADMKGFIATTLAAAPAMIEAQLKEPIYLAYSYDEEVGCSGCRDMVEHIAKMQIRPRLCIVGEPTSMKVINAHKGIRSYQTIIKGLSAHSSAPHLGANAIVAAAQLIGFLVELAEDAKAQTDHRFMPPYTTSNIGLIEGGNAVNIIAENATFSWEFRSIPGYDGNSHLEKFEKYATQVILPKLRETAPEATIETIERSNAPPLMAEDDSDAERFVLRLARANETGAVAYTTEAGVFQQTGEVPSIVCGPGSIDVAHKADEYLELSELQACEAFIGRLIEALS